MKDIIEQKEKLTTIEKCKAAPNTDPGDTLGGGKSFTTLV